MRLPFPGFVRAVLLVVGLAGCFEGFTSIRADGPADNKSESVRPIPPPGTPLDAKAQMRLTAEVTRLRNALDVAAKQDTAGIRTEIDALLRAVELAIEDQVFYEPADLKRADRLLTEAEQRMTRLSAAGDRLQVLGISAGADQPILTAGGYRSRIDGSVQPYGLVIPAGFDPADKKPYRLDVWLHGRGEKSLELQFIDSRLQQVGQIAPERTLVLHPFGRYCNAFKFAGEVDVIEAIEHVQRHFPIDANRISIRGFSMGGAGCWQLAAHEPGRWFAATPGAGFSETLQFLKEFQGEDFQPTDTQRKMLHWYDCPGWTRNFRLLPLVAYSGELDKQKQAADVMAAAFEARDMKLHHVIGPQTAHKIHPESLEEIETWLAEQSQRGRKPVPREIDFTTFTLRHAQSGWLRVEGMQEHWTEARVQAKIEEPQTIRLTVSGVTQIGIDFGPGECPLMGTPQIIINQEPFLGPEIAADGSLRFQLVFQKDDWWVLEGEDVMLRKRPGLQGPIDDAFLESFVFVKPTRPCTHGETERWVSDEWKHATGEWRRHFRGDVRAVLDKDVSDEQIRDSNLVIFGCPNANLFLSRIAEKLPIRWNDEVIQVGEQKFDPAHHAVVMIYPNPLNPKRYIVLNSGFTYREYAYLNNARQVPMLPDWAIIDLRQPPDARMPGKVVAEGFFDEQWGLKAP